MVQDETAGDETRSLTFREQLPRPVAWFLLATAITFTLFSVTMALWAAGDVPQWASVGLFGALTAALYLAAAHVFRYRRTLTIDRTRGVLTDRKRTVFGVTHREWSAADFREVLAARTHETGAVCDEAWLVPRAVGVQAFHLRRSTRDAGSEPGLGAILAEWLQLPLREHGPS